MNERFNAFRVWFHATHSEIVPKPQEPRAYGFGVVEETAWSAWQAGHAPLEARVKELEEHLKMCGAAGDIMVADLDKADAFCQKVERHAAFHEHQDMEI